MRYKFSVKVTDVFERKSRKHVSGFGENAVFSSDSAGWYVRLNDNLSLYVGKDKPYFERGQQLYLTLRDN